MSPLTSKHLQKNITMFPKTNIYKTFILLTLFLLTSGCSISFQQSAKDNLGGVFKSIDSGNTWTISSSIPTTTGQPQSIANLDNKFFLLDPSDNKALYFGSISNGLFYSFDAAKTWTIAQGLRQLKPDTLTISPKSKCTIYTSSANKIHKSTDCTRSWKNIYVNDNSATKITAIHVDEFENNIIYAGTSAGELITSNNNGSTWKLINKFPSSIHQIEASPFNSKILLVSTKTRGLFKSTNAGITWTDLKKIKELSNTLNINDIQFSSVTSALVYIANGQSLLKSTNNGTTWKTVNLITKAKGANINSIALGSTNSDLIYYTTNTTLYKSTDAGIEWSTMNLPSSRAGKTIIVDPTNDNILYLAVRSKK